MAHARVAYLWAALFKKLLTSTQATNASIRVYFQQAFIPSETKDTIKNWLGLDDPDNLSLEWLHRPPVANRQANPWAGARVKAEVVAAAVAVGVAGTGIDRTTRTRSLEYFYVGEGLYYYVAPWLKH
ncbi:hypothetical protein FPV67DRAFT_1449980 [Lyophyllum atratum]|nr:hypothetical protein FPV67DRAFT_1449980 [Lyophyllum atratum]